MGASPVDQVEGCARGPAASCSVWDNARHAQVGVLRRRRHNLQRGKWRTAEGIPRNTASGGPSSGRHARLRLGRTAEPAGLRRVGARRCGVRSFLPEAPAGEWQRTGLMVSELRVGHTLSGDGAWPPASLILSAWERYPCRSALRRLSAQGPETRECLALRSFL
jgi:hypothetical protein